METMLSALGVLAGVIVVCIVLWAVRRLVVAFDVKEPVATVIYVIAVMLVLLAFLQNNGWLLHRFR